MLFNEWKIRVKEDGMFDDVCEECVDDASKSNLSKPIKSRSTKYAEWMIRKDNMLEFIEAIGVHDFVEEEELTALIDQNKGLMNFVEITNALSEILIKEKKIAVKELIDTDFNLPADRVTKILKLLVKDYQMKQNPSEVDQLFISEIKYAIQQINQRRIFNTTEKAFELMHKHESQNLLVPSHKSDAGHQSSGGKLSIEEKKTSRLGRLSVRIKWMNEFSDVGSEVLSFNNLKMAKAVSQHLNFSKEDEQ